MVRVMAPLWRDFRVHNGTGSMNVGCVNGRCRKCNIAPEFPSALQYVKDVKVALGKEKHADFLQVLKDFKSGSIEVTEVIRRVEGLFQGDAQLITGFNQFLPPGYSLSSVP